ncbi:MAG: molecular chaperone DnaK [Pseudarthrobacter sp.]|nr:molecular chaperone DnaK [Pseudarthrobacter sp.]
MSYILAIDVGTSFTAAAIARTDRDAPPVPESLPLGLRGTSVPSVLYYPEEGPVLVGEAAERRGLDSPGRVVREFKRRIGDTVPIAVGTLALPAEEVFATMARWVADRAEEREGAPPSEIILSHPAAWGSHRTGVIREALAARGLGNATLISEPVAAALHYAAQVRVADGSTIAVYDLGGGTFDSAVLRKTDAGTFEVLGRPEGIDGLGGADFDAEVLRHVAAHTGDALAALDPADPAALAALGRLRRECVEAKEALSSDSEANISVFLPGVQQQVRLVRAEFEAMIAEPLRATVDALERSLDELGLEAEDLTAVLLIGGSSRIPLVAQLISEQLDRPIAVDADPKSSICLGAAVAALGASRPAPASAGVAVPGLAAVEPAGAAMAGIDVAGAGPAVVGAAAVGPAIVEPHGAGRRASWSRKAEAEPGSLTGTAAAGVGARAHGGAHRPRPTMRLTAVAAAAALFTVLTATAAQSPEGGLGLGSLTSLLAPPEAEADDPGSATADAGAAAADGATADAAAGSGAVGSAQAPMRGIEASVDKKKDQPAGSGSVGAAPTATPTDGAAALPATGSGTPDTAAGGGSTGGTGGSAPEPTQASGGAGSGTPTGTPTGGTTDPPVPAPDPTTDPPAPVPDPTTNPPVPVPDPTTDPPAPVPDPTTNPPAPVPDPTTDPQAPVPDPTTDPPPQPTVTQAADPVPTEPAA